MVSCEEKEKYAIIIQSCYRGYIVRKKLRELTDNMSFPLMSRLINRYNQNLIFVKKFNKLLSKKKIRNENFPSHISENIAKYAIYKKYKIMPCWDTKKGDIVIDKLNLQIEVKGFMSDGPTSFGPTENWDLIYFVDCRKTLEKKFKVYEVKLSNRDEKFRSIKLNKTDTYGDICDKNQRGKLRGCFEKIFKPQLGDECKLIFDGVLKKLDNRV